MSRKKAEALLERIVQFYDTVANRGRKSTVKHFGKKDTAFNDLWDHFKI